ncbi:MAG TPA: hypothetical protein VF960_03855 [Chloroflexota bacterium]
MARGIFTLTHLNEEQERLLKEAESTLGANILLAFSDSTVRPSQLDESQLECLQGLEEKIGVTVIAVEPE